MSANAAGYSSAGAVFTRSLVPFTASATTLARRATACAPAPEWEETTTTEDTGVLFDGLGAVR